MSDGEELSTTILIGPFQLEGKLAFALRLPVNPKLVFLVVPVILSEFESLVLPMPLRIAVQI
jgi:hypothetical protein